MSNTVFRLIKYCKDRYETTFKCIFFTYFSHSVHTLQLIQQLANTAERQIKLHWGIYTAPTPPLEISRGKQDWHLKQWITNSQRHWGANVDPRNYLWWKKPPQYQYHLQNKYARNRLKENKTPLSTESVKYFSF